ncbi:hypothetical protein AVEN_39006-1 [Araneus ventricosus]|uniref:Uncharacterized protein n=1 Tax=Araneus ventricosus TaxID=182803 RepID=A0A4Y2DR00_ARAVE|nr:hypothetical protein AVEN_39006-1 [Araneus ventricosus]
MLENHTFDKKREKPLVLHYGLAVLLSTRGTDVFNLGLDKQTKHSSRGVSLSCPGKEYLLVIRGTDVDSHTRIKLLYTLKVIVSGTRNVLNITTCNLSSNVEQPKREMPGAIEPGLGLNNVITFYLLLCAGIGNTWTSR